MGRIVVFENPLDQEQARTFKHTGPFIDWLLLHYPGGLPGAHFATLNAKRIRHEDYDVTIGDDDVLHLALFPGFPVGAIAAAWGFWAAAAAFVANIAIAIGLSYLVNSLFGVKGGLPTSLNSVSVDTEKAGSVYNLNTPTNTARIGGVIPIVYGKNWLYPDQGMQPYSYYEDNQQYICQMQVLGIGDFAIHNVKVGGSYSSDFATDVFQYWHIPPSQHQNRFGLVQAQTGIYENVYTSPEVSDQELIAGSMGSIVNLECSNGGVPAGNSNDMYASFTFSEKQPYWGNIVESGDRVHMYFTEGPYVDHGLYENIFILTAAQASYAAREPEAFAWIGYRWGHVNNEDSSYRWPTSYRGFAILTTNINAIEDGENSSGPAIGPFACSPP